MKIKKASASVAEKHTAILVKDFSDLTASILNPKELEYIKDQFETYKTRSFVFNNLHQVVFVNLPELKDDFIQDAEAFRKAGHQVAQEAITLHLEELQVVYEGLEAYAPLAFAEGMALSAYQFDAYKKSDDQKAITLKEAVLVSSEIEERSIALLNIVVESVHRTRDWVNMPLSHLNATKLAELAEEQGKANGIAVEVFSKGKIEALKMGGLLAVNKGSIDPPTFTIMEWKPEEAINENPYILVGKGVVFDTGGMNIKTGQFMENMKSDMAGAATMANTLVAIAKAKLPLHVIALLPATDNRVNGNAYVTGDVITMYDGTSVEVINTDAEGRMILADALAYAKKYDPLMVFDAATLTGAAMRAIGSHGVVAMGNAPEEMNQLKTSGENVYERIAEFPFWDEYSEELKSDIADCKHLAGAEGGAIHAGKFLEKFTNYPYIHLDIAGVAHVTANKGYHGKGGTGIGVRLLFDFFCNQQ